MKCAKCEAEVVSNAKFCSECGAATSTACSQCGVAIPTTAKFCLECGALQSQQQEKQDSSESVPVPDQPIKGTAATLEESAPDLFSVMCSEPEESESSNRRVPWLIIGGLVLVVILILAVRTGDHLKDSKAQPSSEPPSSSPTAGEQTASASGKSWSRIEGIEGLPAVAYIDTGSIMCSANGNVQVWEKFEYPQGSSALLSAKRYLKEIGRPYDRYSSTQTLL